MVVLCIQFRVRVRGLCFNMPLHDIPGPTWLLLFEINVPKYQKQSMLKIFRKSVTHLNFTNIPPGISELDAGPHVHLTFSLM